ncbi:glutamine amidotransferase-related protein [Fastidiosibacter lacustris]|uniref:glutamine amidotransferase-related protein n=1 Tax=Fastidiosibacter lacustris TaxID=2056695 RepID=UPI000E352BEB|nr:glutamine amidotransferase [Fastidiosibacter lacustris]
MKKANVIQHILFEGIGNIEIALLQRGFTIFNYYAPTDDLSNVSDCDLLIILGAPVSVNDDKIYPYLMEEKQILKQRVLNDLPTIGICLGAQLLAEVTGSKIYSGDVKEIGWHEIYSNENTILSHFNNEMAFHWHGDTFDANDKMEVIAKSKLYIQAFIIGKNILGLQFHPEYQGGNEIEKWLIGHACELNTNKIDVFKMRTDNMLYSDWYQSLSSKLWAQYLDNINLGLRTVH